VYFCFLGVVHAPGPWPTFEIQRAQDDFNFLSWQLGSQIKEEDLGNKRKEFQLRGLADTKAFLEEVVDWERSTDPDFKQSFHRPIRILEEGNWGRRFQIFFDEFYGEGFEVRQGHSYQRPPSTPLPPTTIINSEEKKGLEEPLPWGGIVWSGKGDLNGNPLDAENDLQSEFLVLPGVTATFKAITSSLYVYTVFPLR
jgi:hypothetical protein